MAVVVERYDAAQVVEEFCAVYPAQVLVDGVFYCEKSRVVDMVVEGRTVTARVLAEMPHLVTLPLDFSHLNSTCDCGGEGYCEHIAAVAFTLFAQHGDPRAYLEQRNTAARNLMPSVMTERRPDETRKPHESRDPRQVADVRGARDLHEPRESRDVRQAADIREAPDSAEPRKSRAASGSPGGTKSGGTSGTKEQQKPLSLMEDEGLAGWIRYLTNFVEWRYDSRNVRNLPDLRRRMDEWLKSASNWKRQNRTLFTVVVALVVIREVDQMLLRTGSNEDLHRFMKNLTPSSEEDLLDFAIDRLYDAVRAIHHGFLSWLRLQDVSLLVDLVRSVVLHPKNSGTHLTAFKLVWSWMLFHVTEPEDEIERLQVQKRKAQKSDAAQLPVLKQAVAFLYVLSHDDTAARAELSDAGLQGVLLVLPLLDDMTEHRHFHRVYPWLQFLSPRLDADDWSQGDVIRDAAHQWVKLAAQLPEADEECFVFLKLWAEVAADEWDDYLIETGRYEVFVDDYLALGLSLGDAQQQHVRRIESKAPHALLPYFHQLIEEYVQEKKRDSYRAAAHLLKDLRALYRRQKAMQKWDIFIDKFVERHGRLRALMEEMQDGGLVP
jgi:hypothetical protein